jgi:hypothetical protein
MFQRKNRKIIFIMALTAALLLAVTSIALADQLSGDADSLVLETPHANELTATQNSGTSVSYDFSAVINNTGNSSNDVFPGSVSVAIAMSGDWKSGGTSGPFVFAAYDTPQAGTITIDVPCGAEGTIKTMTVVLTAGASTNGKTLNPYTVHLSYIITAGPDDASCAPTNTTPSVTANDATFSEGTSATYSASWSDPDVGQTHTCTINFGDDSVYYAGIIAPTQPSASGTCSSDHKYQDGPNSYTITVKVSDGIAIGSDTATAKVNNVAPVVAKPAWQSTTVDCRAPATLTGISFSDAGEIDFPWTVGIDWQDGSTSFETNTQGAQASQSHTYNTPGTYAATVTVTDKDDGFGSNTSASLTVRQVYTIDFLQPFDDSTPSGLIVNSMKNGRVVPVKVRIYDVCAQSYVINPATVTIKVSKTGGTGGSTDPVEEYADAGASSAGTNLFRWTSDTSLPEGGFWIYNLDSKALGLVTNNLYRVDVYVGSNQATVNDWAVLNPVK